MMIDTCVNMQEASVNQVNMNFNDEEASLILAKQISEYQEPFAYPFAPPQAAV